MPGREDDMNMIASRINRLTPGGGREKRLTPNRGGFEEPTLKVRLDGTTIGEGPQGGVIRGSEWVHPGVVASYPLGFGKGIP